MIAYTNYLADTRPRREAEALAARGDDVEFYSLRENGAPRDEVVRGVLVHRLPMKRYRGGSSIRYIAAYSWFFILAMVRTSWMYFVRRYDVIHVHTMPDFLVFAAWVPKWQGAKIVLDMHDMMPELYMSKFNYPESHPIIRIIRWEERISFNFAHSIICVHELHRRILLQRGAPEKNLFCILNVPDTAVFQIREIPEQSCRMVYHGTIARRLGLDIALAAFRRVAQEHPDIRFDIYGDGDGSEEVTQMIDRMGLTERVYFPRKFFRVEDVPSLISGAIFGIIPNRRDIATEYMLPVKMLEYVCLDIPVVAPQLKTIQWYFPPNAAIYYPSEDAAAMAGQILRFINDDKGRLRIAHEAKRCLIPYDWDRIKHVLFKIIDQ